MIVHLPNCCPGIVLRFGELLHDGAGHKKFRDVDQSLPRGFEWFRRDHALLEMLDQRRKKHWLQYIKFKLGLAPARSYKSHGLVHLYHGHADLFVSWAYTRLWVVRAQRQYPESSTASYQGYLLERRFLGRWIHKSSLPWYWETQVPSPLWLSDLRYL
jgi:hypothetical protein